MQVSGNRRWEIHPEYGFFVKPVYSGIDYNVEELEEILREGHRRINGSVQLNTGYQWNRSL